MKKKIRKVNNEFDRFKLMQRIKLDVEGMGWNVNAIDPNFTDFFVYLLDPMDTGFVFAFSGGYGSLLEAEKNTFPMNEITGCLTGRGCVLRQPRCVPVGD